MGRMYAKAKEAIRAVIAREKDERSASREQAASTSVAALPRSCSLRVSNPQNIVFSSVQRGLVRATRLDREGSVELW